MITYLLLGLCVLIIVSMIVGRFLYYKKKFNDGVCKVCGSRLERGSTIDVYFKCNACGYRFDSVFDFKSKLEIKEKQQKTLEIINEKRIKIGLPEIKTYKEYKKIYK